MFQHEFIKRLDSCRILTAERISSLTGDVMEELSRLWFNIYEPDIVEKNILLLEQHVRTLFVDITNESVKRRDDLQAEVNRMWKSRCSFVDRSSRRPTSL